MHGCNPVECKYPPRETLREQKVRDNPRASCQKSARKALSRNEKSGAVNTQRGRKSPFSLIFEKNN